MNQASKEVARDALYRCCSSARFADQLTSQRPFKSVDDLLIKAELIWSQLSQTDWLEAFSHHPRIGGNLAALREKFQTTKAWASQEQQGVSSASEETLQALSQGNEDYEKKFGFVFLICATGKSADEMLLALKTRLPNTKEQELKNAWGEQRKITEIRLKKLLGE